MDDPESLERPATPNSYPYSSELAATIRERRERGEEIDERTEPGFNPKEAIGHVSGPLLELAGPTEIGHYFLDDARLPSQPIISNIAEGTLTAPDGQKETHDRLLNQLLDVRHLDLPDNSVGMIIAAHLPAIDEEDFDFSDFDDEANADYERRQSLAEQAVEELAESGELDEASIKQSLRLTAAQEIHRCLKPGGLYLADGTPAERAAFERLGYNVVAAVNGKPDNEPPYYYMMLQKVADSNPANPHG
jgi:hypothetical protein